MKKFFRNIAIVLLAVSGTACSLDTESMSSIDSQTYYKTLADAKAALVGCYDGFRRTVSGGAHPSFYVASEVMSDDCFGATGNGQGVAINSFGIGVFFGAVIVACRTVSAQFKQNLSFGGAGDHGDHAQNHDQCQQYG